MTRRELARKVWNQLKDLMIAYEVYDDITLLDRREDFENTMAATIGNSFDDAVKVVPRDNEKRLAKVDNTVIVLNKPVDGLFKAVSIAFKDGDGQFVVEPNQELVIRCLDRQIFIVCRTV
jgi:hypothetical protein